MSKDSGLLYDDVNAWTHLPVDKVVPGLDRDNKVGKQTLMRYRTDLRQSQRFYLSNDFLEKMMEVSADFEQVKRWTNIARLPYTKMWIEFDCQYKTEISRRRNTLIHPEDHPDNTFARMGLLLETLDQETGVWAMTGFMAEKGKDAEIFPTGMTFFFAPEGPSHICLRPGPPWDRGQGLWHGHPAEMQIMRYAHIGLGVTGENGLAAHPEFDNRLTLANAPLMAEMIYQSAISSKSELSRRQMAEKFGHALRTELFEHAGIVRQVITVLAMMNQVPTVKHYFPAGGHRLRHRKSIPFLDHNVITLQLPKTKAIPYIVKTLNKESDDRRRNRAHMVRGHFRTIEYGKSSRCKHAPTMVENGVGICLRCEQMIRWIPEKQRGDASLGWVVHDYLVEAS